ncbi:hypothetical protein [Streptomyces sp. NPDC060198]|uniref:hypothetical protein n=1 Tax=Streptomyces sp. NPDC060198 TaxID=3347070 RepID=UPI003659559B
MPTSTPAGAWLARADPDHEHADRWLKSAGVVLLPLGRFWSAVRCDGYDGLAAAAAVSGPIVHDPVGQVVYFLVPTSTEWPDLPGSQLLGDTCWLAVPAPDRLEPPGVHWLQAPDGSGLLVDPAALAAAFTARTAVVR